ncbi:helix-turn-helix domain-containing protein [Afifella marina]|uniref:Helix-turn-helix domain-containing protein n=1 Tax=Afifella marina DSM 2698 TaxID=1120955 RepID=A0A1G5P2R4_AFIMA|nr:helix-turn-helix transcriptional regulator [Afifella marina]MBK1624275.1 XRE family transcriptional regulator [Afifella marina DSM 2698]MBK1628008.1 XRE family transcriptional regulator [Afifella marina]MBK5918202.1 transcriptional regulator [Afifella marina]RAI19243.1 transcriptional regulator [Afifella marina DSM 2698]SCZ43391.1 Helix-turn-helix domain-containing protein [Afifella marina DSM 2698]
MTPDQFKAWRKKLGMKQKEAADRLGLKKRMIQYYETGERDGKKVKIPKSVRLACYALSVGICDYDGETASYEDGLDTIDETNSESEPSAVAEIN